MVHFPVPSSGTHFAIRGTFRAASLLFALNLSACGILGPTGCDAFGSELMRVRVLDQLTGQPVLTPLEVAFFSLASGDSLVRVLPDGAADPVYMLEAGGRWNGGRYAIEVRATGYRLWRRDEVRVEFRGSCNRPDAPLVTARLQRL